MPFDSEEEQKHEYLCLLVPTTSTLGTKQTLPGNILEVIRRLEVSCAGSAALF